MPWIVATLDQYDGVCQDDDEDAEEEDDSPALAASQSLDILALNLPPEKYMAALLAQVPVPLINPRLSIGKVPGTLGT